MACVIFGTLATTLALSPRNALATPSTTVWAPATPALQGFGVLHLTYDTYFASAGLDPSFAVAIAYVAGCDRL